MQCLSFLLGQIAFLRWNLQVTLRVITYIVEYRSRGWE